MDNLPQRVIDTELVTFCKLDSATARGKVIDKGFACISYIWGEEGEDNTKPVINVDGNNKEYPTPDAVKRNLIWAIIYAKYIGVKYVWIDAMCIDQENPEEINEEVKKMHIYFTVCDLVIVWTAKKVLKEKIQYNMINALGQFYQSQWLRRSWTMQEGVLANRLVVATDDGIIFPDIMYNNEKKDVSLVELEIMLESRYKRNLIASEVLQLAGGRKASFTVDRVQSLSAMLPYTMYLQIDRNLSIDKAEDEYLDACFANNDISPLCCFLNKDAIDDQNWSWKPNFSMCLFPSNVRLSVYKACRHPKITTRGLRLDVKILSCNTNIDNISSVDWEQDFPKSEISNLKKAAILRKENGLFEFRNPQILEKIILFITKDKYSGNSNLRILMLEPIFGSIKPSLVSFDRVEYKSDLYHDKCIRMLLPGIVANGLEVGILVQFEEKNNTYRRLGLSIMSQTVALQAMSLPLTQVILV